MDQGTFGKVTKHNKHDSQEVSPFPAGDQEATQNRHGSTTHTNINRNLQNLFFTYSSSCMFFRAGWHRVGLYKLLAKMDFHVIAVDYRGNVQEFVLKLQTVF